MIDLAAVPTRLIQRPLATNETWTQDGRNRLTGGTFVAKTRYTAYADQAGTMYVEESNDGAAWTTLKTVAVTAGNLADSGWVNLSKRDYRVRYVNGAVAQTVFSLYQATAAGLTDAEPEGFTWAKAVAAAAGDQTVKATPGKVAKVYIETATVVVYVKDGANQAWTAVTGAAGQDFPAPLACQTDIRLNFSAAGTAWVLYR